MIYID
jgi:vitellogenic carboxypeptidase-like protein